MFKSITPSTEARWSYAQPTDDTGHAPAMPGGWLGIVSGVQNYFASVAEQRRLRRARMELERLDDRMLKDIGVTRCEIGRVVRYGRGL